MTDDDHIEISYQFTIEQGKDGLVFGLPDFEYDGNKNPTNFDDIDFKDIFDWILDDPELKTIMTNRPDTIDGYAMIQGA